MSKTQWAEEFLERFVVPLLLGYEVHVGEPLGMLGVHKLRSAAAGGLSATPIGETLQFAQKERLTALGWSVHPPSLHEDDPSVLLLVALHDLLFLAHPDAGRLSPKQFTAVANGARRLGREAGLSAVAGEADLAAIYGRHSLLGRLWQLSRHDSLRSTRRGVQIYKGKRPPRRWLPISETPDEIRCVEILPEIVALGEGMGALVLQTMLLASPLTDLLQPLRIPLYSGLHVNWLAQARWLRQPAVARVVVRRYLELGLAAVGPVLSAGLLELLSSRSKSAERRIATDRDLHTWLCLLSHLHLIRHVIAETPLPAADSPAALLDFYGLFAALFAQHPFLAMPPDIASDRFLRPRIEQHARRCRRLAGSARIHALTEQLPEQ